MRPPRLYNEPGGCYATTMTDEERIWLAGVIDGAAMITQTRQGVRASRLELTYYGDERVVDALCRIAGGSKSKNRRRWRWRMVSTAAAKLLEQVEPHLRVPLEERLRD